MYRLLTKLAIVLSSPAVVWGYAEKIRRLTQNLWGRSQSHSTNPETLRRIYWDLEGQRDVLKSAVNKNEKLAKAPLAFDGFRGVH